MVCLHCHRRSRNTIILHKRWLGRRNMNNMNCAGSTAKPNSPPVERTYSRRRSPSPRAFVKRAQSPSIDPHVEADMNRVKKQVPKALKARLYLLQQPGPNSFLIGGDSPDHKYKVIIGPQTCTCGKDPFCLHILFVMLRVFQVKETEALLWTRDLKNYEVEGLFRKYHKRIAVLTKQKVSGLNSTNKMPHMHGALPDPLVAGGHSSHSSITGGKEEEEVCPICLSDLVEGESMTLCKEGCQNRLHHHCMAVWAEECRRRKEALNCPLCRTLWQSKRTVSPAKNSCANSLNVLAIDTSGLPAGEIIPDGFKTLAQPWVQVFGNDAVACMFSRDWKHRESGLRFVSRKAVKILTEKKTTVSYLETKWELLAVCSAILTHIMADPVYNVYVAALRTFRAIVSNIKYRSREEINQFHVTIKPVIEKIMLKCTDANRRITIISMKVLMEFVHGEYNTNGDGMFVDQYMVLLFSCLNRPEAAEAVQWQWWLGRLTFIRRLSEEHLSVLLKTEGHDCINLSLPVSRNSDIDLHAFLNSLEENVCTSFIFNETTRRRLQTLVQFSAEAVASVNHKKVHRFALFLLVKFIAVSSQDCNFFSKIKEIVHRLRPTVQSTLHRHLSSAAQQEQENILHILDEHEDQEGNTSLENELNNSVENEDSEDHGAVAASNQMLTPPPSPSNKHRPSPPQSAYDPRLQCAQQVEDEEAAALALAMDKSLRRPENVIPEQLIPVDDLTLVHIQAGGAEGDSCHSKNVYLENIHWKKSSLLGTGAFSSCFESMDFKSGRLMAVKQISFCRNTEDEQRKVHEIVLEEIALLHRLKHMNVVQCLGATQHEGHYNLFLELMPGGSISGLLSRFGPFREPVIKSYTQQILYGVSYLHEHHTLHRDLKGANLLVDSTGQIVKLTDFGTAARLMAHGTGTKEFCGQLLGTIPFMSPEVLRGEHYGRKCDIWSIGCCVIEMAAGAPPWGAEQFDNHLALMFKIASATSAPPLPSSLGPGLRDLGLRCLELKEADRPTANELLKHVLFRS